jgi:hypothetical protein
MRVNEGTLIRILDKRDQADVLTPEVRAALVASFDQPVPVLNPSERKALGWITTIDLNEDTSITARVFWNRNLEQDDIAAIYAGTMRPVCFIQREMDDTIGAFRVNATLNSVVLRIQNAQPA